VSDLIRGGQADPSVKLMIEKLEGENKKKQVEIEDIKAQMAK
jgi:hypothetical protein